MTEIYIATHKKLSYTPLPPIYKWVQCEENRERFADLYHAVKTFREKDKTFGKVNIIRGYCTFLPTDEESIHTARNGVSLIPGQSI